MSHIPPSPTDNPGALGDIQSHRLLYIKAFLFLLAGCLAAFLILFEHPELKTALLLAIAVWCFARTYFFIFYVIEHYIDPNYRFAGLYTFARYMLRRRRGA